ncbi:PREDICTED: solute carrier family 25 member 46-like [Priapulus caudatus]|uniref:Solute carrier family 25 member 46-like n=1 Tax=Priapulus caudatus TaxID=37621 RepID=A0ABM1DZ13_PRICU|nr:PREDICTED: solute carrier family 25 member 46-like [Priapulus caudatus]
MDRDELYQQRPSGLTPPPLISVHDEPKPQRSQEHIQRFAGFGIGVTSLFAENLLSHPCIVLRRQCQVHHNSTWYHLTPFTIIPIIVNIQTHQGIASLWKGIGGTFVVRGLNLIAETVLSEFTSFSREVTRYTCYKNLGGHVTLKFLTFAITTPFAAASLVETVQSDIASERPGMLDVIKEGLRRVTRWGTPQTTRLLPVYLLVVPTALHSLAHYAITRLVQQAVVARLRPDDDATYRPVSGSPCWGLVASVVQLARGCSVHSGGGHPSASDPSSSSPAPPPRRTIHEAYLPDLIAVFSSHLIADVILYPAETVVARLHLQGTRTIIDNLDFGYEVAPINTCYEGAADAVRSILRDEGLAGFYKGFGALALQYATHALLLRATKLVFDRLAESYAGRPATGRGGDGDAAAAS